jgi:hypothetical protein|tara:strand:- start:469 stop:768 length:300 start_codon:yes stop_codon:yes gene_type:complete
MQLLTKAQKAKMIKNYKNQDGTKEFKAVVKLFNPTGQGSWYLSELNPDTNVAFGLCKISDEEFGYVDLNELTSFKGQMGLSIERDRWFIPTNFSDLKLA